MARTNRTAAGRAGGASHESFSWLACRDRARKLLSVPPTKSWIARPEPRGEVVAEFALPLRLLPTTNATRGASGWKIGKLKRALVPLMWAQSPPESVDFPLAGRPQVLCVRFTASPPDACSDWAKHAVDMLCKATLRAPKRLGLIVDDSPWHIDLHQWSEPAGRGDGFAYLQVRTGGAR